MRLKIAPTRGNLVKTAKAVIMAQQGHDLLDKKRQVLMAELVRHMNLAKKVQKDVSKVFLDAYTSLEKANMSIGIDFVGELAQSVPEVTDIVVRLRSVMGVEIPEVDELNVKPMPCYSFLNSSGAVDKAYLNARRVLLLLTQLAQVETTVYRLAVQVRKTFRRVNALEKVVIPMNKQIIRVITDVLEESERDDLVRMKMAKALHEGK